MRGIGYGSARSDLNMATIKGEDKIRIKRPDVKAAYIGGRCMRFK
jgi:c-di-AMP phosphodiesterase-like protein